MFGIRALTVFHSHFIRFCTKLVCFDGLKLSVNDILVNQNGSNGDRNLQFFGWDYNCMSSFVGITR